MAVTEFQWEPVKQRRRYVYGVYGGLEYPNRAKLRHLPCNKIVNDISYGSRRQDIAYANYYANESAKEHIAQCAASTDAPADTGA